MKPWYTRVLRANDPSLRAEVKKAVLEQEGPRPQDRVGCVIEFLRGDRHRCGVVQPAPYGRSVLWVLDQEGREGWVRGRKVVDISPEKLAERSREGLVRQLRQIDTQREAVKQGLDMQTLWETVAESGQEVWTLDELAALYFGPQPGRDGRAALARALEEGRWFNRQEREYTPLAARVVEQHRRALARRQEADTRLRESAHWLREVMDGKAAARPAHAGEVIALLEEAALYGRESARAGEAALLMQSAHLHGPLAAFEVLVRLGHWQPDENLDLFRLQVPVPFAEGALAEAVAAAWAPEAARCRRWWGRRVWGIAAEDGACAWAFSLRRTWSGFKLGLHFPAPGLLLAPGGALQQDVATRGAALRLPDREVPLLPPEIAAEAALSTGERRPSLTVEVRLNKGFAIEAYTVGLRRVRVGKLLGSGEELGVDGPGRWLTELAGSLRAQRLASGAFLLPEQSTELRAREGQVAVEPVAWEPSIGLLIEEFEVLAESLVGQWCAREGIPALYLMESLPAAGSDPGGPWTPARRYALQRGLSRDHLQLNPEVNLRRGAGFCVPMRRSLERYIDLVMQQQLAHWVATGRPRYSGAELERMLEEGAWAREVAERVTRGAQRYWGLKYLEGRVGQVLEAEILERPSAGYLIEVEGCQVRAFLPGNRERRGVPGDRLRVEIVQVSARREQLLLRQV